jgi:N-acetylmuramoyl-L-alanine amidase
VLVLVPTPAYSQENTVRIVVDGDPQAGGVIGVFRSKGILYASLTDLAATFRVTPFENHQMAKMEVKQGPYRIKVTGGSPFIVVTDQSGNQTVYQLPANVLYAARSFFVPLQSFVPFFGLVFNKSGSFEITSNTLRVESAPPASLYQISAIDLEPKANGMLVRVRSSKRIKDIESWLRQDGWLYVTLVDVKANVGAINAMKANGLVKDIVAIQSPTSVQLTFKLAGKIAATEILREDDSHDLLIAIRTPGALDAPAESAPEKPQSGNAPAVKPPPVQQHQQQPPEVASERNAGTPALPDMEGRKRRWDLDVIVIDPGHGGKDPGTIGVTGLKEKDVVLSIGLKLGELLKRHLPGVKIVYTRATDVFIPLYRRGQIANEAGGKLFVSIHCNATPRKPSPTRGTEVYLLRPNRSEEAIAIAEQENAVITLEEGYEDRYQELTDENFILVTMAQTAYMRSSEILAEQVHRELSKVPGLRGRGVRQAGFYVLVGAAMPNVLVETAFVSNREDEKLLRSKASQSRIAESLYQGIARYKKQYEKLLTNE